MRTPRARTLRRWGRWLALGLLLLLTFVAGATLALADGTPDGPPDGPNASSAPADGGAGEVRIVRACGVVLDSPGRYVLVDDLRNRESVPCITVRSGDVVVDGAGHRIVDDGTGTGVLVEAPEGTELADVTVEDLVVEGFELGIYHPFGQPSLTGLAVVNTTVSGSSGTAMALQDTDDLTLTGNAVVDNEWGIVVEEFGRGVEVRDNRIAGNRHTGLFLFEGGQDPVVSGNVVADNGRGIYASNDIEDPQFVDNEVLDNRGIGIVVKISYDAVVRDNRVTRNDGPGISVSDGNGRVVDNEVVSNGGPGVRVVLGGATVTGNRLVENGADGVQLNGSDGRVEDNLVRGNGGSGLRVDEGWAVVSGNQLLENDGDGVHVVGAGSRDDAESRVVDNRIVGNCGVGVHFEAGSGVVLDNVISGNATCD